MFAGRHIQIERRRGFPQAVRREQINAGNNRGKDACLLKNHRGRFECPVRHQVILRGFDVLAPNKVEGTLERSIELVAIGGKCDSVFNRSYRGSGIGREADLDRDLILGWAEMQLAFKRAIPTFAPGQERCAGHLRMERRTAKRLSPALTRTTDSEVSSAATQLSPSRISTSSRYPVPAAETEMRRVLPSSTTVSAAGARGAESNKKASHAHGENKQFLLGESPLLNFVELTRGRRPRTRS